MSNKGGCPFYRSDAGANFCKVPKMKKTKNIACDGYAKKCQDLDKALAYCREMKTA